MSKAVEELTRPHPRPLPEGEGGRAPRFERAATELGYAPPLPLRRRKVVRRAALLAVLAGVAASALWWFPHVRDHVVLLGLQRRCLNHAPPPDEVVFDEGPGRADALMADGRYQHFAGPPPAAFLVAPYWRDLYARLSPPGLRSHGTVFLHGMRTPGGEYRLVAIDMSVGNPSGSIDSILLTARVIDPATLVAGPRLLSTTSVEFIPYGLRGRVTPGQIDPKDPTHVVLLSGRIDAWLGDDDRVKLRPRDVTPPAPSSPASLPTSAAPATRPSGRPGGR